MFRVYLGRQVRPAYLTAAYNYWFVLGLTVNSIFADTSVSCVSRILQKVVINRALAPYPWRPSVAQLDFCTVLFITFSLNRYQQRAVAQLWLMSFYRGGHIGHWKRPTMWQSLERSRTLVSATKGLCQKNTICRLKIPTLDGKHP